MNPKNLNNERELVESISVEMDTSEELRSWAEPGWFADPEFNQNAQARPCNLLGPHLMYILETEPAA